MCVCVLPTGSFTDGVFVFPADMNSASPSSSLVASRHPELGAGNVPMYREQLQHQIMQVNRATSIPRFV